MNKLLKHTLKKISLKEKETGDYQIPDCITICKENQKIVDDISTILNHERFCHEGWLGGYNYQKDAAYFILSHLRALGKIQL